MSLVLAQASVLSQAGYIARLTAPCEGERSIGVFAVEHYYSASSVNDPSSSKTVIAGKICSSEVFHVKRNWRRITAQIVSYTDERITGVDSGY